MDAAGPVLLANMKTLVDVRHTLFASGANVSCIITRIR